MPKLKRRLESLEEALETKLYGRHGKEFELTVSGDLLVSKLQRADGLLDGEALVWAGVGFGLSNAIRLKGDVTELTEFRPFHHPFHLMVRRDFFSHPVNKEFVDLLVAYSRARFGRSGVIT